MKNSASTHSASPADGARLSLCRLRRKIVVWPLVVSFTTLSCGIGNVSANPQGGQVAAGAATIQSNGAQLTVNQTTNSAIINWDSFSIGAGEHTNFIQPNAGASVLNRVTGGNLSQIYGTLTATGSVYLINPNGIVFGPNGIVDVGGSFTASSFDIPDSAFLKGGDLTFAGENGAAIVNHGVIKARNGDVALVGFHVVNTGEIDARSGDVLLGAGNNILLKAEGTNRLFVLSDASENDETQDHEDETVGVENSGIIAAVSTELKAAGGNLYALAVNSSGIIRATGVANRNGRIVLTSDGGSISLDGRLTARDADGSGGEVLVGGAYQGGNAAEVANAALVTASANSVIDVSASAERGNGGQAIVWADETTTFAGHIDATGGTVEGDGGFAEVSGKQKLNMTGTADLRAANGANGTLLLDPTDITIGSADNNVNSGSDPVVPTGGSSVLSVSTLQTLLAGGNVTVSTDAGGTDAGNITVSQAVNWSSNNALTLDADNNVAINANITNTGSGSMTVDMSETTNSGTFTLNSGATIEIPTFNIKIREDATLSGVVKVTTLDLQATSGTNAIGNFTAENASNQIGTFTTGSSFVRGSFSLRDSAGGLIINNSSNFEISGNATFRTVGDLTVKGTNKIDVTGANKTMRYEASGGSFIVESGATGSGRMLVYADSASISASGFPQIATTSNADFGSDPVGTGNVLYKPAVASSSASDTKEESDAFGEGNSADQENQQTGTVAQRVYINVSQIEPEEEEETEETSFEIESHSGLTVGIGEDDVQLESTSTPVVKEELTVTGQFSQINGFVLPTRGGVVLDNIFSQAFERYVKNTGFPGSLEDFQTALSNGDTEAQSFAFGSMLQEVERLRMTPDGAMTPDEAEFVEAVERFITDRRAAMAAAATAAVVKWENEPSANMSKLFRRPFPDVVTAAAQTIPGLTVEKQGQLNAVLSGSGVALAGAAGALFAAGVGHVAAVSAASIMVSLETTAMAAGTGAAAGSAGTGAAAGSAGGVGAAAAAVPAAIVVVAAAIGVAGAVQMSKDAANEKAYDDLIKSAQTRADIKNMDPTDVGAYLSLMIMGV